MPRKMTDTTPLKGIPSRVPSSGFRSPPTQSQGRPNFGRMSAGRKDVGIKLLEITEQPLGYAAAKKRKRQQELEEQQKKLLENQNNNNSPTPTTPTTISVTTPDYAAGLTATSVYTQPPTPSAPIKIERPVSPTPVVTIVTTASSTSSTSNALVVTVSSVVVSTVSVTSVTSSPRNIMRTSLITSTTPVLTNSSISTPSTTSVSTNPPIISSSQIITTPTSNIQTIPTKVIISQPSVQNLFTSSQTAIKQENTSNKIIITSNKPNLISTVATATPTIIKCTQSQSQSGMQTVISSANNIIQIPRQTTIKQVPKSIQSNTITHTQQYQPPKIVQIKTTPTIVVSSANNITAHQNIPPLIPTQPQTSTNKINIQNIQNFNIPLNRLQLENSTPTNIIRMATPHQTTIQQSPVSSASQQTQQKIGQLVMSPTGVNVKGKTIILTNPNQLSQKGVIIRSVGPSGNTVYQQIPLSNVSGLANIINTGTQSIIKTEPNTTQKPQQIPALVPTSSFQNIPSLTPVMITSSNMQQQTIPALMQTNLSNVQNQQKTATIIRPVQMANVQSVNVLPQGLTLIQRPGQQPQLIQMNQTIQQPMQRTIITQQTSQQSETVRPQIRQQTIYVPQQQVQQIQGTTQARKGVTVPVSYNSSFVCKNLFIINIFFSRKSVM